MAGSGRDLPPDPLSSLFAPLFFLLAAFFVLDQISTGYVSFSLPYKSQDCFVCRAIDL